MEKETKKEDTPIVKELVEEKRKEEVKRKKFGMGFLFGLIVGVIACVGILVIHSITREEKVENKENTSTEEKNNALNQNSEEAKTLMKQLSNYDLLPYFYYDLGKEEITNQDLLYFALSKIGFKESFTLTEVEKVIETYFDYEIKPESIACRKSFHEETEYLYLYDTKTKKFVTNEKHGGHGGGHISPYQIYNRFVSLKEKKYDTKELEYPEYELVVSRAYSSLAEDTGIGETAYYATYKDAYEEKQVLFDVEYDENFNVKTDIEKELEKLDSKKLSKETFTFIKKDNKYLLIKYRVE